MKRPVIILCILAFGVVLRVPLASRAAAQVDLSAKIAAAKSAADQEAIASDLEQEAKDFEAKAALHVEMAKHYATEKYAPQRKLRMKKHCEELSANLRKAAELAREMAKVHHELAQTAGK